MREAEIFSLRSTSKGNLENGAGAIVEVFGVTSA